MNNNLFKMKQAAALLWMVAVVEPTLAVGQQAHQSEQKRFDRLLSVNPQAADEYIYLQSEVSTLTLALQKAQENYHALVKGYSEFQADKGNEYNRNEKFKLFFQFDNQQYQLKLNESGRDVQRVKLKLNEAVSRFSQLQAQVEEKYLEKNVLGDADLRDKLRSGETVAFSKKQQPLVFDFLSSLGHNPGSLAKMLGNKHIVAILPDYLKEQLRMFEEAGIALNSALKNPTVMQAFISSINSIELTHQDDTKGVVLSIYDDDKALQISQLDAKPVKLNRDLAADTNEELDPVYFYYIPAPSDGVLDSIGAPIGDVRDSTSVYDELSDYSLDNVNWSDIEVNFEPANPAVYLTQLNEAHGPLEGNVTSSLPSDISARFNGAMVGSYMQTGDEVSGTITIDATFNGNSNTTIEGSFILGGELVGSIEETQLTGPSDFQANISAGDGQAGALTGSFFGETAQEMGGVWALGEDTNGQNAISGGFKAKQ